MRWFFYAILDEEVVRFWVWKIIKWFLFKLNAESAHQLSVAFIRIGILMKGVPLRLISGASQIREEERSQVFGISFATRIGLAAGFDKNCEILEGLPALGFGFAEIGTVTPRPQSGNNRPRLFRDPDKELLFNRMGFNNLGASLISERLYSAKKKLPEYFRVGVNLGKNRDTQLENASRDYIKAAQPFEGLADYLVINVSSPNTPGLRSLQTVEALKPIVSGVVDLISGWRKPPPLLLKLAPEVAGEELSLLIQSLEPCGVEGWVLTNTLSGTFNFASESISGGWSGKLLSDLARQRLIEARRVSQKSIISVGGIFSCEEACARISAGADLLQFYTSWIYRGPGFPVDLAASIQNRKSKVCQ